MPLAGNTTAVCCPAGARCVQIEPIDCNMELQDASRKPDAKIHTTALTSVLGKCGDACCPFGYTCNEQLKCAMDVDQSQPPPGASRSPPPTSTSTQPPTSSNTGDPANTDPASTSPANPNPTDPEANKNEGKDDDKAFPTTAVVVGVLVGVLGLVSIIVFLLIWRTKRRKRLPDNNGKSSSRNSKASSSFGNIISEPIINHDAFRTDFIRKPESPPGPSSSLSGTDRLSRMFSRQRDSHAPAVSPTGSATLRDSRGSSTHAAIGTAVPIPPIRAMNVARPTPRPITPKMQREPSSESINIFAAPGTVERGDASRPLTSFTEMMDQADLGPVHKGKGFVPSPLRVDTGGRFV